MLESLRLHSVSACVLFAIGLSGCAAYSTGSFNQVPYPPHMNIPKGHMPPPGQCRIWFPDRPPGQQPPPGDCYDLEHQVPPDAVLVRG